MYNLQQLESYFILNKKIKEVANIWIQAYAGYGYSARSVELVKKEGEFFVRFNYSHYDGMFISSLIEIRADFIFLDKDALIENAKKQKFIDDEIYKKEILEKQNKIREFEATKEYQEYLKLKGTHTCFNYFSGAPL